MHRPLTLATYTELTGPEAAEHGHYYFGNIRRGPAAKVLLILQDCILEQPRAGERVALFAGWHVVSGEKCVEHGGRWMESNVRYLDVCSDSGNVVRALNPVFEFSIVPVNQEG